MDRFYVIENFDADGRGQYESQLWFGDSNDLADADEETSPGEYLFSIYKNFAVLKVVSKLLNDAAGE